MSHVTPRDRSLFIKSGGGGYESFLMGREWASKKKNEKARVGIKKFGAEWAAKFFCPHAE